MKSCPFRTLIIVGIVLFSAIFSHNMGHKKVAVNQKNSDINALENSSKEVKMMHKVEKLLL